jgi:hypothetical protein
LHLLFSFSVFLDVPFRTSDILCSMTSNICHVIFYVSVLKFLPWKLSRSRGHTKFLLIVNSLIIEIVSQPRCFVTTMKHVYWLSFEQVMLNLNCFVSASWVATGKYCAVALLRIVEMVAQKISTPTTQFVQRVQLSSEETVQWHKLWQLLDTNLPRQLQYINVFHQKKKYNI